MEYSSDLAVAEILERKHQGSFIRQNDESENEAM